MNKDNIQELVSIQSQLLNSLVSLLKSGGKLCVNISDVNAGNKGGKKAWQKICDPMNEFLDEYPHADLELKKIRTAKEFIENKYK